MLKFFNFIDSLSVYDIGLGAIVYCILSFFLISFLTHFRTTQETISFCCINVGLITGAIVLNRYLFHNVPLLSKSMLYIGAIFVINLVIFTLCKLYFAFTDSRSYNIKKYLTDVANSSETRATTSQDEKKDDKIYKIENYNYYYQQNDDKYADPYTSKAHTSDVQNFYNKNKTKIVQETKSNETTNNHTGASTDIVLPQKNTAQIEENVMQKVKVLINENNVKIDNKINELNENISNIGDGVQGMVNRMSKLFELINQTIKVQIKQQQEG